MPKMPQLPDAYRSMDNEVSRHEAHREAESAKIKGNTEKKMLTIVGKCGKFSNNESEVWIFGGNYWDQGPEAP